MSDLDVLPEGYMHDALVTTVRDMLTPQDRQTVRRLMDHFYILDADENGVTVPHSPRITGYASRALQVVLHDKLVGDHSHNYLLARAALRTINWYSRDWHALAESYLTDAERAA